MVFWNDWFVKKRSELSKPASSSLYEQMKETNKHASKTKLSLSGVITGPDLSKTISGLLLLHLICFRICLGPFSY
jgi:hypothetical protein